MAKAVFAYWAEFFRFQDCENWIASSLECAGHPCFRMQRNAGPFDPDRMMRGLEKASPDILLLSKTPEIDADQFAYIRRNFRGKIVFWTFDWMMHPTTAAWYLPLARQAAVCFQTDGYGEAAQYRDLGINRIELHQGAMTTSWHRPVTDVTAIERERYSCDVTFAGSEYTPARRELVRELSRYNFKKWGAPEREIWGRPFSIAMGRSKIVVGDNYTNLCPGYFSDRVYLALACGAVFLGSRVEGMEREFQPGKHLMTWGSLDELHSQIEFLLNSPLTRKSIARAGRREVLRRHSYKHRIAAMIGHLEKLR